MTGTETTKPSPWRTTKKLRGMCFLPHTHPKPPVKAHTSHTHATHPHRHNPHKARRQNLGMYIQHCLSQRCTFGNFFCPKTIIGLPHRLFSVPSGVFLGARTYQHGRDGPWEGRVVHWRRFRDRARERFRWRLKQVFDQLHE